MNRNAIATTARAPSGAMALVRLVFDGGHRPGEGAVASP